MNEILLETEDKSKVAVPVKIMLDAQTIEQLSSSIKTQQPIVEFKNQQEVLRTPISRELNPQLNNLTAIKVREAIPCGTSRQLSTDTFEVEATEVDAPLDGQDAKQAMQEAERKANVLADSMLDTIKGNYTCSDKNCTLKFSVKKIQIGETQFFEQSALLGSSVRHKAVINVKGEVTLQCVPRQFF